MSEVKNFRKQFWKERKTVGSMTPSSRFLTKKMLRNIDFSKRKVIVELGPGTGVFTREIIKKMTPDSILLVFEINDTFFQDLSKKISDSRVHLIHDSAVKIEEYLSKYDLQEADVVISSLPLAVIDANIRSAILENTKKSLKKGGKFIQFQYSLQSKGLLKKLYKEIKISFTILNFPPAFVYTCRNK